MVDGLELEQSARLPRCERVSESISVFDRSMFSGHRYTLGLTTFCRRASRRTCVVSPVCSCLLAGQVALQLKRSLVWLLHASAPFTRRTAVYMLSCTCCHVHHEGKIKLTRIGFLDEAVARPHTEIFKKIPLLIEQIDLVEGKLSNSVFVSRIAINFLLQHFRDRIVESFGHFFFFFAYSL